MKTPEKYRVKSGAMGSNEKYGNNGMFVIPVNHNKKMKHELTVIASDGLGWDHVSVSRRDNTPTWAEMCAVKDMFWNDDEVVIQYHPAKKDYVNNHEYCLHMWKKQGYEFPVPDFLLV